MAEDKPANAGDDKRETKPEGKAEAVKKSGKADKAKAGAAAPAKKAAPKKVVRKTAADRQQEAKASKEEKKKKLEEIITKRFGSGAEKKHAIDALQKEIADGIIMSKNSTAAEKKKAAEELKRRAAEAKKRAQQEILSQNYIYDQQEGLNRLADMFDKSARRWEMVVYPSMFAFILLAGYGFYLIYHLTHDISVLSRSVTHMAVIVSDAMPKMSGDMRGMTNNIKEMTSSVDSMTGNIETMTSELDQMSDQMNTLEPMSRNLANMTHTMGNMNRSVYGMQRDMSGMNRTISNGPFGFMQDMMPFSSNSYTRPPPPVIYPPANPKPVYPQQSAPAVQKKTSPVKRDSPKSGMQPQDKETLAKKP